MARLAKKEVAALYLSCPYCSHELTAIRGSLMFTHEDLDGRTVRCPDCESLVKLPDWGPR